MNLRRTTLLILILFFSTSDLFAQKNNSQTKYIGTPDSFDSIPFNLIVIDSVPLKCNFPKDSAFNCFDSASIYIVMNIYFNKDSAYINSFDILSIKFYKNDSLVEHYYPNSVVLSDINKLVDKKKYSRKIWVLYKLLQDKLKQLKITPSGFTKKYNKSGDISYSYFVLLKRCLK